MINGLFDRTITLLGDALDLRASRQKVLASNIANQETPGYRARDINFEDELRNREGGVQAGVILASTNASHIGPASSGSPEPQVVERATDLAGYDGNSVGIEGEMVKLSENALMYTVAAKMLRSKFATLMNA
ncbi:MAG: flagellar basal body rod protein FlgB, partial [Deltaproteobacteria bacterium]|nr:flagellar basal body rod protein FlgB [Deltaproteobacteria bacterium]